MKKVFENYHQWLENRSSNITIGSSDIPSILGVNKYSTPYELWLIKMGLKENKDNKFMFAGRHLEQAVANMFKEMTGHNILEGSEKYIVYYDDEKSFLSASPDREIKLSYFTDEYPEEEYSLDDIGILECKTTQENITDIPDYWYFQVQYQLAITGHKFAFIAYLIRGVDFAYKFIKRNEEVIKFVKEVAIEFYEKYIVTQTPPPIEDVKIYEIISTKDKEIEAKEDILDIYFKLKELNTELKYLEKKRDEYQSIIKEYMKDSELLTKDGKVLVSWKLTSSSKVFDSKRFLLEYPDLYNKFLVSTPPQRRFYVK